MVLVGLILAAPVLLVLFTLWLAASPLWKVILAACVIYAFVSVFCPRDERRA
jgi:hypothetical protein